MAATEVSPARVRFGVARVRYGLARNGAGPVFAAHRAFECGLTRLATGGLPKSKRQAVMYMIEALPAQRGR